MEGGRASLPSFSKHADWRDGDDPVRLAEEDREEENRLRREPAADGKYYDDPLWYGKTKDQIRYAFDLEKAWHSQTMCSPPLANGFVHVRACVS